MICENKNCNNEADTTFAGIEVCNSCYKEMVSNIFSHKEDLDSKQKSLIDYKK